VPVVVAAWAPEVPALDWLAAGAPVEAELAVLVAACAFEDPVPHWLDEGVPVDVELEVLVEACAPGPVPD
jgi:hypothetical protein